jgi:predicted metal-dependent enzyme (double-stranded beta helix superfamily)
MISPRSTRNARAGTISSVVQGLDEGVKVFDTETFVAHCRDALDEANPRLAIKRALTEAMSDPASVARALPPNRAEIVRLHTSPELTILNVVWAPGMHFGPHDHRMWAAIGIYSGGEDNAFFRRSGNTLTPSSGKALRPGDVTLLGDDTVHAVTNPTAEFAGAIHIYGGDFFAVPRSEWDPQTLQERPFDLERAKEVFAEANRRLVSPDTVSS